MRRHDGRYLRREPHAFAKRGINIVHRRVALRIECGQRGYRRPKHVHRMRILRRLDYREYRIWESPRVPEFRIKVTQLRLRWQFAIQQQVGRLLKRGFLCQVMNVVSAILQDTLIPVDEGGVRAVEVDTHQAAMKFDFAVSRHVELDRC